MILGRVFGFWDVFWILGRVFGFWEVFWILGRVFGFWDVFFLDSGKCFGFWDVFCPYEPPYDFLRVQFFSTKFLHTRLSVGGASLLENWILEEDV